ncbi:flippase [Hungatella hathewayi]|uniref:flippase n=1 Tax=Hungatella hathewayi TaxID=154046 RepID=UPI00356AC583
MIDKSIKQVFFNIGWLIFDKLFILAMNLIVIFTIANYYGPEKYGLYQYSLNIVLILEVAVQLIDGRVVKKQYNEDNYDEVVFNVTLAKLLLSIIIMGISSIVILFSKREEEFSFILFILLLDSIVKNLRFGMENRFEYILQSKKVVIASNIGLLAGTFLQLSAVCFHASIIYLSLIQLTATFISMVILYLQYRKNFRSHVFKQKINKLLILDIGRESLPLAIASAAATIYTRCDSVMLGMILTTKEVGIYSIASKLISTIQILAIPIQTTIYIKMMEWKKDPIKYEKNYIRITSAATWISIVGVLLSFIVLPYIFTLLKPDYLPAIDSYKILSVGSICAYNAVLRSCHFTITGNGKILMQTQIITVIINILLNYSFISVWGMNGAAIATAVSQFISLIVSNIFYKDARFVIKAQWKALNPIHIVQ